MEKENKFKLKLSRIFTNSCKTQDISEVIDHQNPIFTQQTPLLLEQEHFPTSTTIKQQAPLLMCKPKCPESFDQMVRENCITPRRKLAGRYTLLSPSGDFSGRRCPPASPASPLFQKQSNTNTKTKKKKKNKREFIKFEKTHLRNNPYSLSSSNETDNNNNGDWFSSDDEREDDDYETETLFSSVKSHSFSSKSVSLSSDSEAHFPARTRRRRPKRKQKVGSGRAGPREEVGAVPLQGKVKVRDTFAVVKSSSDPYSDFRTSMVEMIIEKQIFGTKDLEMLLDCFLSLNAPHHHRVIVEVFTEIWDALFSHCS